MLAIGHLALGYILGKGTSKLAHVHVNLPLLFAASLLPDIDLLFSFVMHRGVTHSLLTLTALMVPFLIVYRRKVLPYFAALLSHVLIADFFTGGSKLLWPLSNDMYGVFSYDVLSFQVAAVELVLFLIALPFMVKLGDLQRLLKPCRRNWALIIPLGAVVGPLIGLGEIETGFLSPLLVIPSLFFAIVFVFSIFIWVWKLQDCFVRE